MKARAVLAWCVGEGIASVSERERWLGRHGNWSLRREAFNLPINWTVLVIDLISRRKFSYVISQLSVSFLFLVLTLYGKFYRGWWVQVRGTYTYSFAMIVGRLW